jgi:hypothetical protein
MFELVLVVVLSSAVAAVYGDGSCDHLFPSTGGVYTETCIFNGFGSFQSSTIGFNQRYYLLSIDIDDATNPDLEHYTLSSIGSPTFNATQNCVVLQQMYVYEATKGGFVLEASSNATNVNVFGEHVMLTPGVVNSPGACFMTRVFGNACFQLGLNVQTAFAKHGLKIPVDVKKACLW